ncbi:MAG: EVE domain-containing protein [Planctomycetota bacterium]
MPRRAKRYWLLKSEPDVFSFDDLMRSKGRRTVWDGVRNYQARNFMRDEMAVGDGVLYYHSNAKPPGVAGLAEVASEAYPDPTQFDSKHKYFDPKSPEDDPRWWLVDVVGVQELPEFVSLDVLKADSALDQMVVTQRGSRLSVQPVTAKEWKRVCSLGGL